MKVVICAIVVLIEVQALTEQQVELAKKNHDDCLAESPLSPVLLLIFKATQGKFSEDPAFKEHIFCFSKKAGFQNEAGEIQRDAIKAKLSAEVDSPEIADEIMSKCLIQKDTPQETAFQVIKCYYKYVHSQEKAS